MASSKLLVVVAATLTLTFLVLPSSCRGQEQADEDYVRGHICSIDTKNFTLNSTYHSNLRFLLTVLSSNATGNADGFFNATTGKDPDKAYGYFLCRGDVSPSDCATCVRGIAREALDTAHCPTEKEAMFWEPKCFVRYGDWNFFSKMSNSPYGMNYRRDNVTDPGRFNRELTASLRRASAKAANWTKRYATIKLETGNSNVAYSLVQCMPDLSGRQCGGCLQGAVAQLIDYRGGARGAALFYPSCSVRYEMYEFFNYDVAADADPANASAPAPSDAAASSSSSSGGSRKLLFVVIAIVSSVAASLILFLIRLLTLPRRKATVYSSRGREGGWTQVTGLDSLQYNLAVIQAATNNFSADNLLGRGGFGEVYKGKLPDGQEVAVKRLSKSSVQGAREFKNEVHLLARLQHRNLVRLLGFCLEGDEHILIYEYVPNQSLDCFLFKPEKQAELGWSKRYTLIVGIARGMLYLHEDSRLKVIHRDLKASNILLDRDMNPKISDFGIAKIADQTQGNTSRVVGTFGYIPPEYMMHGQYSVKSDVYSFGVLILEVISGKKNNNFPDIDGAENLISYAWKQWTSGDPLELLDPVMRDSYCRDEVTRCIQIGLLCVEEDPSDRPTMATLVLMLNSSSVTLPSPNQPAFSVPKRSTQVFRRNMEEFNQFANQSMSLSRNEPSITDLYPR